MIVPTTAFLGRMGAVAGCALSAAARLAETGVAGVANAGVGGGVRLGLAAARLLALDPSATARFTLLTLLALLPLVGVWVRFAAATTRALGLAGGGDSTWASVGGDAFLVAGFAPAATGFFTAGFFAGVFAGIFSGVAAAATGVLTAFAATAFAAGRFTDLGVAATGLTAAGLRALLSGAFAVATAAVLVFVAVVLSDFFVVNL